MLADEHRAGHRPNGDKSHEHCNVESVERHELCLFGEVGGRQTGPLFEAACCADRPGKPGIWRFSAPACSSRSDRPTARRPEALPNRARPAALQPPLCGRGPAGGQPGDLFSGASLLARAKKSHKAYKKVLVHLYTFC